MPAAEEKLTSWPVSTRVKKADGRSRPRLAWLFHATIRFRTHAASNRIAPDEVVKVASSCRRGDVYRHRVQEALSGFPEIHADYKDARGRTSFRRYAMITPSLGHDGQFARFA